MVPLNAFIFRITVPLGDTLDTVPDRIDWASLEAFTILLNFIFLADWFWCRGHRWGDAFTLDQFFTLRAGWDFWHAFTVVENSVWLIGTWFLGPCALAISHNFIFFTGYAFSSLLIFDLAIGAADVFLFDTVITVTDHTLDACWVLDFPFDTLVDFFVILVTFWANKINRLFDTYFIFQIETFWA